MARQTASPTSTAGAGYIFEEKVAAYWLLHLLAGRSPLDAELGPLRRIGFQTRADGWLLDDLLATFDRSSQAAVSVKSSQVIRGARAPEDFVHDCWELHLKPGATNFRSSEDRLVLATSGLPSGTRRAVDDAIKRAVKAPDLLDGRIRRPRWASEAVRKFVKSFHCPRDLKKQYGAANLRSGMLLRAIRVLDYDFGRVDSESEKTAITLCRELVRSGTRGDASLLWNEAQRVARTNRTAGGWVDLERFLDELRGKVSLKAHPDYEHDWDALAKASRTWLDDTKDVIGTGLRLPREELSQKLLKGFHDARVVVVLGESGIGKSALFKGLSRSPEIESRSVVYLDASEVAHLGATSRAAGLNYPVEEILSTQTEASALLLLDRLDRLVEPDEFKRVGRVLKSLRLEEANSPWRLGLTCRESSWPTVKRQLSDAGIELRSALSIHVSGFTRDEVAAIARQLPGLALVLSRSELSPILSKPKILDLIATAAREGQPMAVAEWVGESSIVEWFWTDYLCSGGRTLSHGNLLKKLAVMQADERRFASPTITLTSTEAEILPDLINAGIILQREETVRFAHDLYADYARQRFLLGQWSSGDRSAIASRLINPIWHHAVSLLGLHYLELSLSDATERIDQWRNLARSCEQEEQPSGVGSDLLLDAVVYSAQPALLLDLLTVDLTANEGRLLKRFLVRVFHVASVPDPRVSQFPNLSEEQRSNLTVQLRLPRFQIWVRILRWVVERRALVLKNAAEEFLPIAETWLRLAREWPKLPISNEVADMVLMLAENAAATFESGRYHEPIHNPELLYILAMLSGRFQPERTLALALRLAGRGPEPPAQAKPADLESPRGRSWPAEWDEPLPPWPDGPYRRQSNEFQDVAVSEPVVSTLIDLDPKLAEEIFLALLISPPRTKNPMFHDSLMHDYDLEYIRGATPAFYDFAPVSKLITKDSGIAIDFILKLSNFATDRWAESWIISQKEFYQAEKSEKDLPRLTLVVGSEPKDYFGDAKVFAWHTGAAAVPHSLEAALMVLEHWLYSEVDKESLRPETVKALLDGSRSVSVIGVLFELARRNPELLLDLLGPLVGAAEVYFWQYESVMTSALRGFGWGLGTRVDEEKFEHARAWISMPHRDIDFRALVSYIFVHKFVATGREWSALEQGRRAWIERRHSRGADAAEQLDYLDTLIEQFDRKNWKETAAPDGTRQFEYIPPPYLAERSDMVRQHTAQEMQKLSFPIDCRRILDGEADCAEKDVQRMLQYALEAGANPDVDQIPGRSMAIRCGAASVAIVKSPEWLAQQPDWMVRCREWLLAGSSSIFAPTHFEERRQIHGGASWDTFCAEGVARLWVHDPDDQELRRAVAKLTSAHTDEAVGRLFSALAPHREQLGLDFQRLLHLGVWVARLNMIFWVSGDGTFGNMAAEFEAATLKFIDRSLPPISEDWAQLSTSWPNSIPKPDTELAQLRRSPVDTHFLQQMFSWLLGEASNFKATDRAFLIKDVLNLSSILFFRFNRQAPSKVRTRRGVLTVDDRHQLGVPDEFDHAVTALNAAYMVNEPDANLRRAMSRKWYTVPKGAPLWLQDLFENIYRYGMDSGDAVAPSFVAVIRDAFEFCLGREGLRSKESTVFHDSEVLQALIGWRRAYGVGQGWKTRWGAEREVIACQLMPLWKKWIEAAIGWHGCATRLLLIASSPACNKLWPQMLTALGTSPAQKWVRDCEEPLVSYLEKIWTEHRTELDAELRNAFDLLLHALLERQVPRAIALSRLMAAGNQA